MSKQCMYKKKKIGCKSMQYQCHPPTHRVGLPLCKRDRPREPAHPRSCTRASTARRLDRKVRHGPAKRKRHACRRGHREANLGGVITGRCGRLAQTRVQSEKVIAVAGSSTAVLLIVEARVELGKEKRKKREKKNSTSIAS
jgi:hypothetical protein